MEEIESCRGSNDGASGQRPKRRRCWPRRMNRAAVWLLWRWSASGTTRQRAARVYPPWRDHRDGSNQGIAANGEG